jgi:hypothetical protein
LSGPRKHPSAQNRMNEANICVGASPLPAWKLNRSKAV